MSLNIGKYIKLLLDFYNKSHNIFKKKLKDFFKQIFNSAFAKFFWFLFNKNLMLIFFFDEMIFNVLL